MDIEKCGEFIRQQRKQAGLTQQELADALNVTNKAVSKWENGRGFPDVSLLEGLSGLLSVSVTELINGEKTEIKNEVRNGEKSEEMAEENSLPEKKPCSGVCAAEPLPPAPGDHRNILKIVVTAGCVAAIAFDMLYIFGENLLYNCRATPGRIFLITLPVVMIYLFIRLVAENILKRRFSFTIALPTAVTAFVFAADVIKNIHLSFSSNMWNLEHAPVILKNIICFCGFQAGLGLAAALLAEAALSAALKPAGNGRSGRRAFIFAAVPLFSGAAEFLSLITSEGYGSDIPGDLLRSLSVAAIAAAVLLGVYFIRKFRRNFVIVRKKDPMTY